MGIPHQATATSQSLGIDKLTEKSLIYLRFVSAHKNQLIDFYRYLFFKTEQKIKNSLIFWLTCQYPDLGYTTIPAINLEELELLRKAGLDGDAILASVTESPANYWGFEGFGRIVPGNRANLLILDADPRKDLTSLTRPVAIYLNGSKLSSQTISNNAK